LRCELECLENILNIKAWHLTAILKLQFTPLQWKIQKKR